MCSVDEIFEMLSCEKEKNVQMRGIEEAKKINHLSVFFQPIEGKKLWDNCAKVLASKSDQELKPYLILMFKWFQDGGNWPGTNIIWERLERMPISILKESYEACCSLAQQTGDEIWQETLEDFMLGRKAKELRE